MATQKEVLEEVEKFGFYEAHLRKNNRSTCGSEEVSPAKKLVEKGLLRLASENRIANDDGWTIIYRFEKAD
jgi:hypothetical protein